MKPGPVHLCCLCLLAATAAAQQPPPGYVEWASQNYTLDAGESMQFHVDWDQIPVRRWILLVEGNLRISYLNLRRPRDGSLVYDNGNESRHMVEIPWGEGESLSCHLRADERGAYAVSLWGPPRDRYLRAYAYEVNRALEDLERDDRSGALAHLLTALQVDPDDVVAQTLLLGLDGRGGAGTGRGESLAAFPDPEVLQRLEAVRAYAASLRDEGRFRAAADTLQLTIAPELGAGGMALIYGDLADLFLDLENPVQARAALDAAAALGLDADEVARLRKRLDDEAASGR